MSDNTLTQQHLHQEFYRSSKVQQHHDARFASNLFGKDTIDACYELKSKVGYETKTLTSALNGQNKCTTETTIKEYSDTTESKSFIQQRVERLYGPGALAQGFFVSKRQKGRDSESENENSFNTSNTSDLINNSRIENGTSPMKQSSSSPALPVLRHLRPEFRAQLPIINPRKNLEASMQKSSTVPILKEEPKINGHSKQIAASEGNQVGQSAITEETGEKDGHYFLKVLQNEANRLLKLADNVESELESNEGLSEEVIGKIRSASGKARLLVSQKMQQFKGLCTNNITQSGSEAFPTTNEDLQGFWDMVMLQVDQVNALFMEIEALKANNWQEVKSEIVNATTVNGRTKKQPIRAKPSAGNEEMRKKREAQRKQMIEERRRAMKNKPVKSIEIFVPESS